jgi:hypothetical protein
MPDRCGVARLSIFRTDSARIWTQRADNVLALMEKVPSGAEGSPEKNFQRAVWSLCQKLKDSEADGGQLIVSSIVSD